MDQEKRKETDPNLQDLAFSNLIIEFFLCTNLDKNKQFDMKKQDLAHLTSSRVGSHGDDIL